MGYYTKFKLELDCPDPDDLQENFEKICGFPIECLDDDVMKWYNHIENMNELSKLYPEILFGLYGVGDETGDIWIRYFKNGKSQYCEAKISFDPFILLMNLS